MRIAFKSDVMGIAECGTVRGVSSERCESESIHVVVIAVQYHWL